MNTIGIIGGVGPLATSLYRDSLIDKVVAATQGTSPEIIVHSLPIDAEIENAFIQGYEYVDTKIYMRTQRIMSHALETFMKMGIETIAMPCNTLQPLLEDSCKGKLIHNINLIEETSRQVVKQRVKRVLIIGTNETCRSNIYGDALKRLGVKYTYLAERDQKIVAQHISASLRTPQDASPYWESFVECIVHTSKDVDGLVIACTDLAGHWLSEHLSIPVIDSLQVLVDSSAKYILS